MKIKIKIFDSPADCLGHVVIFYVCGKNMSIEKHRLYMNKKGMYAIVYEYFKSAKSIRTIQKIKKMENEIRKMKESL